MSRSAKFLAVSFKDAYKKRGPNLQGSLYSRDLLCIGENITKPSTDQSEQWKLVARLPRQPIRGRYYYFYRVNSSSAPSSAFLPAKIIFRVSYYKKLFYG